MPQFGRHDVRSFFDTYVFGFMCADIERELNLARAGQPAGNFLCALGLLCYTEFMGGLLLKNVCVKPKKRFDAFFDYIGPDYRKFGQTCTVYDVFRCGLAHEYFVKRECTIFMLNGPDPLTVAGITRMGPSMYIPDATLQPPIKVGIGRASNGRYFFIVEQYYQDFRDACKRLLKELETDPNGGLPFGVTWWLK